MAVFLKNTNSMRRFRKTRKGGEGILESLQQGVTGLTQGLTGVLEKAKDTASGAASGALGAVNNSVDSARDVFNPAAELASQHAEPVPVGPNSGGRRRSRRRKSRKSRKSRRR